MLPLTTAERIRLYMHVVRLCKYFSSVAVLYSPAAVVPVFGATAFYNAIPHTHNAPPLGNIAEIRMQAVTPASVENYNTVLILSYSSFISYNPKTVSLFSSSILKACVNASLSFFASNNSKLSSSSSTLYHFIFRPSFLLFSAVCIYTGFGPSAPALQKAPKGFSIYKTYPKANQ